MKQRLTLGLIEEVTLEDGNKYLAKIDTGADSSSIDETIALRLGSKEVVSYKVIKSALGRVRRPTIEIGLELQKLKFKEKITIADRSHLKYKVLIGQDILKKEGFLIDPLKKRVTKNDNWNWNKR